MAKEGSFFSIPFLSLNFDFMENIFICFTDDLRGNFLVLWRRLKLPTYKTKHHISISHWMVSIMVHIEYVFMIIVHEPSFYD